MAGRVVHFEIPFDNGDRAREFYREAFGHREVLVWSGAAYCLIAVLALTSRAVRTLDRIPVTSPGSAAGVAGESR